MQVGSVVSGSVAGTGGVLRIPVELVDVATGQQKWGRSYEGSLSDLPKLQHEISTEVAYSLKISLSPDTQARLVRQYSTNALAYDAFLKGRFNLAKRTRDTLQEAIKDFQSALDHDPQYAPAFAGLADCYSLLGYYGLQDPIPSFKKALDAAQQALELDSTLSDAYASRALARTFLNFEWQEAEQDYRRALALNPGYLAAHNWYALLLLVPLRRPSEAAVQTTYMKAVDPASLVTVASTATMNYFAGNYDKTIASIAPHIQEFQQFEPVIEVLAMAYLAEGKNENVVRLLAVAPGAPDELIADRAGRVGIAFARMGQRGKALAQLKILESAIQKGGDFSYEAAALYVALNERQRALDMLELAYTRRESSVIFVNVDPLLVSLRSEPRFSKLLGQMNLQ
jgi:serine/threonine-protein kinase